VGYGVCHMIFLFQWAGKKNKNDATEEISPIGAPLLNLNGSKAIVDRLCDACESLVITAHSFVFRPAQKVSRLAFRNIDPSWLRCKILAAV
jgi:hypothetical protein